MIWTHCVRDRAAGNAQETSRLPRRMGTFVPENTKLACNSRPLHASAARKYFQTALAVLRATPAMMQACVGVVFAAYAEASKTQLRQGRAGGGQA